MNAKKMTYKELEQRVIENRCTMSRTKDMELKRRLIAENHEMMLEMDARWEAAKK